MVAEQGSKLRGNPLLKVRGTIPYIVFENEISHPCFSKTKRTNANIEKLCLGRRLLRMCDVFKFRRNWLLIGKRIQ